MEINTSELEVLKVAAQQILDCTNGEFGYLEDAETPDGMTRNQFKGYCGQLSQKGLISVSHDEFKSLTLTAEGVRVLQENNLFADKEFDTL